MNLIPKCVLISWRFFPLFNFHRYESTTSPKRVEYERRSRLVMRIVFMLGITLFLALLVSFFFLSKTQLIKFLLMSIVTNVKLFDFFRFFFLLLLTITLQIFYIAVYMTNYNETDRMIFLNKIESNSVDPSYLRPLTTVFYPDDQISSYQHTVLSTTPMPGKKNTSNNKTSAENEKDKKFINSLPTTMTWHPSNHKRQYSNVHRKKNELDSDTDLVKKSLLSTMIPQKRMFFADEDFDYGDTYQNVNSIQDILNQNVNENENNSDDVGYIAPSMPFSRTMKVEGIYRREKTKRDHFSAMETIQRGQRNSLYDESVMRKKDPFSEFKPTKPGDVNLLATNLMKHMHYTHHRPRPLTTAATLNNYYEDYYGSQDPNIIYHQIIAANNKNRDASIRNGRYEKPLKTNKPFSLMLDVYPMAEEMAYDSSQAAISTRVTPYNQHRRPLYPINSQAINHNLQYNKENSFYNHMKFPQIQQYPYPRTTYVMNHNQRDGFFRNYVTQRTNSHVYRPMPMLKPSPPIPFATEEQPSQITVHLNLYPDRKKYQTRNVEIIENGGAAAEQTKNNVSLWKRVENITTANSTDVRPPTRNTYIPPFSAIKINALEHAFDMNDTNLSLQSEQPEKSVEYDMVTFDSKKLVPNIKSINIIPTAKSMLSTASYFNEMSPTISSDLSTMLPSQFESTMSSSMFTSSIANHFPLFSTHIPFETTPATELFDVRKSDQTTTVADETQ